MTFIQNNKSNVKSKSLQSPKNVSLSEIKVKCFLKAEKVCTVQCTVYTVSVRNTVHRESHFQEYKLGRKNKEFYFKKKF